MLLELSKVSTYIYYAELYIEYIIYSLEIFGVSILRDTKNIKIGWNLFIHLQKGNSLSIHINNLYLHYMRVFLKQFLQLKYLLL